MTIDERRDTLRRELSESLNDQLRMAAMSTVFSLVTSHGWTPARRLRWTLARSGRRAYQLYQLHQLLWDD